VSIDNSFIERLPQSPIPSVANSFIAQAFDRHGNRSNRQSLAAAW
jgi:hypothetical protein